MCSEAFVCPQGDLPPKGGSICLQRRGGDLSPYGRFASEGGSISRGFWLQRGSASKGGLHPGGLPPGGGGLPNTPVLTSGGSHCSGRYACYWNAFLLCYEICFCENKSDLF